MSNREYRIVHVVLVVVLILLSSRTHIKGLHLLLGILRLLLLELVDLLCLIIVVK